MLVVGMPFELHSSASAPPSANQFPPGGPAMNLSWSGFTEPAENAEPAVARRRIAAIKSIIRFFILSLSCYYELYYMRHFF
jgi:hypothetical protein